MRFRFGLYQFDVDTSDLRREGVPDEAIWSFSPGEFFGIYRPDIFWLDPAP